MMILGKGKGQNKKGMLGLHALLLIISFILIIANACQIGIIHQHATSYNAEVQIIFYSCSFDLKYFSRIPSGMEKSPGKLLLCRWNYSPTSQSSSSPLLLFWSSLTLTRQSSEHCTIICSSFNSSCQPHECNDHGIYFIRLKCRRSRL